MKTGFFHFTPVSAGAFLICIGLTNLSPNAAHADEAKAMAPQVVLAETYNAVTRIYFTNRAQGYAADRTSSDPLLQGVREQGRSGRQPRREPRLATLRIKKNLPVTFPNSVMLTSPCPLRIAIRTAPTGA
jgi:hypothetical protein